MAKTSPRQATETPALLVAQCRACRRFVGFTHREARMYCDDVLCVITREWVWDKDTEETDLFVFLTEVLHIPVAEIAAHLDVDRYRVHSRIKIFKERTLNARM